MKTTQEIARECAADGTKRLSVVFDPEHDGNLFFDYYAVEMALKAIILAALESATAEIIAKNAPEIAKANAEFARLTAERDALRAELDVCKYVEKHDALRAENAKLRGLLDDALELGLGDNVWDVLTRSKIRAAIGIKEGSK
jgi:hypothetical protein